jgi:hypothetical protein
VAAAEVWPPWDVTSAQHRLDSLITTLQTAIEAKVESEILGELSRFLVVRTSGYLERSAHEIFRGFIEGKSGGVVRSFAHSWLERSRNPSPDALSGLIGRFDASLQDEFEKILEADDQRLRRELSSLVSKRNAIAHGMNEGIGHERALGLTVPAKEAVDWLILRLNPYR